LSAYLFSSGSRSFLSSITNCIIQGNTTNNYIYYDQQGMLDIHNVHFSSNRGLIYLRNNAPTPRALTLYNNLNFDLNVEGNWDYQNITGLQIRTVAVPFSMIPSSSAHSFLGNPFIVQGGTRYLIEGVIFVTKTSASSAHFLQMLYSNGTAIISNILVGYMSGAQSSQTTGTASSNGAPTVTTTQITSSNSIQNEFNNIFLFGTFATEDNGGGTFIPQIKYSINVGVGAVLQNISYIKIRPIGNPSTSYF
jgi:hypothetical protein